MCFLFPCDPTLAKLFVIHLITNSSVTAGVGFGGDTVSRKPAIRLANSQETHSLSIDLELSGTAYHSPWAVCPGNGVMWVTAETLPQNHSPWRWRSHTLNDRKESCPSLSNYERKHHFLRVASQFHFPIEPDLKASCTTQSLCITSSFSNVSFWLLVLQNGGSVYFRTQSAFQVGEEESAGSDFQGFLLYPHRCLLWSGWPRLLHRLMGASHPGWLIGNHLLSPWSKPIGLREPFCLVLRLHQPPQYHHFLSLRHTRHFLFPLRCTWYGNFPDLGPESRSDRSTYKYHLLLSSLSLLFPTVLRVERDTLLFLRGTPWVLSSLGVG